MTVLNAVGGSAIVTRPTRPIRLGTRRSALATTQATWVAARLRAAGHEVELVEVTTFGDTSAAALTDIGGTGVFAGALRAALLHDEIDVAVHSLKDLPVAPHPGLVLAAIPAREDSRDVLVARDGLTLGELPTGSTVGTGSPRRAAQIAALGLGLVIRDIRGNVDTRLAAVHDGRYDAVLLARAGLSRLGRLDEVTQTIDPLQLLPAPGQGALAVECRADDDAAISAVLPLDDADTRTCVAAERSLLGALEAGCTAPIGALAELCDGESGLELSLRAFVGEVDGSFELRRSVVRPAGDPEQAGRDLARLLLDDGAGQMTGIAVSAPVPDADTSPARNVPTPDLTAAPHTDHIAPPLVAPPLSAPPHTDSIDSLLDDSNAPAAEHPPEPPVPAGDSTAHGARTAPPAGADHPETIATERVS